MLHYSKPQRLGWGCRCRIWDVLQLKPRNQHGKRPLSRGSAQTWDRCAVRFWTDALWAVTFHALDRRGALLRSLQVSPLLTTGATRSRRAGGPFAALCEAH